MKCAACGSRDCAGYDDCTTNALRAEVKLLRDALRSVIDRCTKDWCSADMPCGPCETARAALVSNHDDTKSETP